MEEHYNRFFAIQRQLHKYSMPEDLVPIVFDYLGKLNETYDDLINKRCLWLIDYEDTLPFYMSKPYRQEMGHYCNVCNKVLFVLNENQLKRHLKSLEHKKTIKHMKPVYNENMNLKRFENALMSTQNKNGKWPKCKKKKILKTIMLKQRELKNEFII